MPRRLIHNFGHGGSGMSLSWGTASMATDLALPHAERKAAVLGSGVVGLTSARELQRHGFDVTIYAATVPPDTTSNMSLAGWTPTSGLVDNQLRTAAWDEQCRQAAAIAYRRLQLLAGPKYGVSWIKQYQPTDNDQAAAGIPIRIPIPSCRRSCRGVVGWCSVPASIRSRRGTASSAMKCASSRRSTSMR